MKKINRKDFLYSAGAFTAFLASETCPVLGKSIPGIENFHPSNMGDVVLSDGICRLEPKDHGKALVNPMMGWTMHFYSNILNNYGSRLAPSDTLDDFPGLSTVYLRVPWAFVEPEEGKYVWELLDTPAQRWIDKGKYVAFRISATESWMYYATPEWVFKAGAKGYDVDGNIFEPDYADPVFLEKVENFIRAMAARYDNNEHVAFVDVGHFGMWGEGHTVITTPKHGHEWGLEVMKKHIDLYCRYFKNTQLCISDDFAGHNRPGKRFPVTDYAFSKGVTLRDDSILVQPPPDSWYHSEMARLFWPEMPVILEHEHYGGAKEKKSWDQDLLVKSIEDYHASFMSVHWWPRILLEENRSAIDRINRRMGYRIRMKKVAWPQSVPIGESFDIHSEWSNAGVAPCYPGGYICYTLKDEKNGIVSVLVDETLNLRELSVAEPGKEDVRMLVSTFRIAPRYADRAGTFFRACPTGTYDLFVSAGKRDGTPVYELPYAGDDGKRRYCLGKITLV